MNKKASGTMPHAFIFAWEMKLKPGKFWIKRYHPKSHGLL